MKNKIDIAKNTLNMVLKLPEDINFRLTEFSPFHDDTVNLYIFFNPYKTFPLNKEYDSEYRKKIYSMRDEIQNILKYMGLHSRLIVFNPTKESFYGELESKLKSLIPKFNQDERISINDIEVFSERDLISPFIRVYLDEQPEYDGRPFNYLVSDIMNEYIDVDDYLIDVRYE